MTERPIKHLNQIELSRRWSLSPRTHKFPYSSLYLSQTAIAQGRRTPHNRRGVHE